MLGLIEDVAQKRNERISIMETGGLRKLNNWAGDGQSTRIFDALISRSNGVLFSVDIDPVCAVLTSQSCSKQTIPVTCDSVWFLSNFSGGSNLTAVYLDSLDLDIYDPEPSAKHHLQEIEILYPSLRPGTIVAVDDNLELEMHDGAKIKVGKGYLVGEFLESKGADLVFDGYQKIWQIPL